MEGIIIIKNKKKKKHTHTLKKLQCELKTKHETQSLVQKGLGPLL